MCLAYWSGAAIYLLIAWSLSSLYPDLSCFKENDDEGWGCSQWGLRAICTYPNTLGSLKEGEESKCCGPVGCRLLNHHLTCCHCGGACIFSRAQSGTGKLMGPRGLVSLTNSMYWYCWYCHWCFYINSRSWCIIYTLVFSHPIRVRGILLTRENWRQRSANGANSPDIYQPGGGSGFSTSVSTLKAFTV